jgi:pyruvate/2-oxoglutarate/acetoin dehydrogenase E1 component
LTYYGELTRAMNLLGEHERSIFIGQSVGCPGTGMTASFEGVPREKLLELPVMEDCQLGMSIGLSLGGYLPVSVFPRINFLLLAMNQLVLHLDAIPRYSDYRPRVIIRTSIATDSPLNPGPQHLSDYVAPLAMMCKTIHVERLDYSSEVYPAYMAALEREASSLLVERAELYDHV